MTLLALAVLDGSCKTRLYELPDLAIQPRDLSHPDLAHPDLTPPPPDFAMPDLTPPPPDFAMPDLTLPPPDFAMPDLAISPSGCADETREGFLDLVVWPRIAGCSGGFRVPGVLSATLLPACGRAAGNDSQNAAGVGCDVEDLCAFGWHVCATAADVMLHSATGCAGAAPGLSRFFITRQSSNGCAICATGNNFMNPPCDAMSCSPGCAQTDVTSNDVFGCGSVGDAPGGGGNTCQPLDRFGNDLCMSLPPSWSCGNDNIREALHVIHLDGTAGGALCCQD